MQTEQLHRSLVESGRAEDDLPNLGMTRYVVVAETEEEAVTASRAIRLAQKLWRCGTCSQACRRKLPGGI